MNKVLIHNTQRRIIYLITAVVFVSVAGFYYYNEVEHYRLLGLINDEQAEDSRLLNKIVQFKFSGLDAYTKDYTYWDEMMNFANTGDTDWAKSNIEVSLVTYDVDYVWVFNDDFKLRYFVSGKNTAAISEDIITGEMVSAVTAGDVRFFHYFIKCSAGILEINGATIHSTSDPERLNKPGGYYAAGRLWSKKRLEEISDLTFTHVDIAMLNTDNIKMNNNHDEFIVRSYLTFNDHNNRPVAYLISSRELINLKIIHRQSENHFIIIIVLVLGILILVTLELYYLVNSPLRKISLSLTDGNPDHIKSLLKKNNEFGNMARLVNEFFTQKQKLLEEIEVRTVTETRIRLSEEKLRSSLKEKEVLIKEIHHRVKNNPQIIMSLIRLQENRIKDEGILEQLDKTLNRIKSISLVHEMLYRSPDLSRINFRDYICTITESLRTIYSDDSREVEIEVSAENILLSVDTAVPCAVIINELVTNSIKQAFKDSHKGKVNITMKKSGRNYILCVEDDGIGICGKVDIYETDTMGMHLVTSLAEQLEAELSVDCKNGTSFTLKFSELN